MAAASLMSVPAAFAAPAKNDPKVRICHATNSMTNPYVSIEVAQSAADGNGGNDKGQGDHYLNHTGAVWTPDASKKTGWGDIIPPIPGIHDGLNWTAAGQAIWSAGCQPVDVSDEDGDRIPDVTDPDTDGDTIPDVTDSDDDGDGVPDAKDPDESGTTDTDGDTIPDAVDSDDDGDGVTDNAECDTPVLEDPPLPPAVEDATTGTDTTTETTLDAPEKDNNANTGVGQDGTGAGAPRSLAALAEGECAPATAVTPTDQDGDGTPDVTDRDQDGDGTPDSRDRDEDGDTIPDSQDPDDDNDSVPDVLDPDHLGPEQDPDDTDTDGDGLYDTDDTDIDGDGVPNTRDADVDGNNQPETLTQEPAKPVTIVPTAPVGEFTRVLAAAPVLDSRQTSHVDVTCTPAKATTRMMPTGGGNADELAAYGCDVKPGKNPKIALRHDKPTVVEVRVTAPAVGPYKALDETYTQIVKPS